jgi:hypothetical protein
MIAWNSVTRAHVMRAMEEYDRLGPERFFAEHGFAPTTTYELWQTTASVHLRRSSALPTNSPPARGWHRVTSRAARAAR